MTDYADPLKRLREFEEGTRGPYTSLATDIRKVLDAIEMLVKERDEARAERDAALKGDVLQMMRAQTKRAEAAEAEVTRLREALQGISDNPTRCGEMHMTRTPTCVRADAARKALEDTK